MILLFRIVSVAAPTTTHETTFENKLENRPNKEKSATVCSI